MLTNKKTVTEQNSRFSSFPLGLTRAVSLDQAELATTEKGKTYGKLRFVQKDLRYGITKFIWIPDYTNITAKPGESNADAKNRVQQDFLRVCTDILLGFGLKEEEATISAIDEKEFLAKFLDKCQTLIRDEGLLCDLVVQMDYKDEYPELPKYNFIAPYVEGAQSPLTKAAQKILDSKSPSKVENTKPSIFDEDDDDTSDDLPF